MPPLSPRQLWLAAAAIGVTKDQVLTLVEAMPDNQAALTLRIELTEALSFERNRPEVADLAALLGIPDGQLDSLWLWAANL